MRRGIKVAALPGGLVSERRRARGVYFLIYHKAGGELRLEIDLPRDLLRRQLAYLRETGGVVKYEEALALLGSGGPPDGDRYVLTFDDGYEEFYTEVYPRLQEFDLPATLFVTTGFVEAGISPLSDPGLAVRPVSWEMLGEMADSGRVTLGAHGHRHRELVGEPEERVIEELARPIELFRRRLGREPAHFAYPRARWDERAERLVKCYYASAAIGGGAKARAEGFHRYRIPRLPVRASDGWGWFRLKMAGWLDGEERLYEGLRRLAGGAH